MNVFKLLPFDIVEYILTFSPTYYKENYKNRKGKFYKQIEQSRKEAITNVYVPIKRRCYMEGFNGYTTIFWTRFLGGKYILYVEDTSDWESENYEYYIENYYNEDYEDNDENYEFDIDPERAYKTKFRRVHNRVHNH